MVYEGPTTKFPESTFLKKGVGGTTWKKKEPARKRGMDNEDCKVPPGPKVDQGRRLKNHRGRGGEKKRGG